MTDVTKFISGCMASLSAMVQLEVPHVNILSKMDLVTNKRDIEEWILVPFVHHFTYLFTVFGKKTNICIFFAISYLNPEPRTLLAELNRRMAPQFEKLNKALIELVSL